MESGRLRRASPTTPTAAWPPCRTSPRWTGISLSANCMAKLKKIGCLFLIGVIILISLLFVADEVDLKWIAEWTSLSFEKEKSSSDMDFSFHDEAVVDNEKIFTLFGTKNEFKSDNNKPIILRTTDGGKSWKKKEEQQNRKKKNERR